MNRNDNDSTLLSASSDSAAIPEPNACADTNTVTDPDEYDMQNQNFGMMGISMPNIGMQNFAIPMNMSSCQPPGMYGVQVPTMTGGMFPYMIGMQNMSAQNVMMQNNGTGDADMNASPNPPNGERTRCLLGLIMSWTRAKSVIIDDEMKHAVDQEEQV
ncbi:hypothetical protein BST61_g1449 [Cercospora zeina]